MMKDWSTYLRRSDGLLVLAGIVGVVLYITLLPAHHPDATARYALTASDAQEAAEAFLAAHGYGVDDLEVEVDLSRNPEHLLDSLQATLGRTDAVALLKTEAGAALPAYYWHVRYFEDGQSLAEEAQVPGRYEIYLTLSGHVWAFENETSPPASDAEPAEHLLRHVDRDALGVVWEHEADRGALLDTVLAAVSDTLLARTLFFEFDRPRAAGRRGPSRGGARGVRPLDRTEAELLARYHLARLLPASMSFRADSVWTVAERGSRLAGVRFETTEPVHGQQVQADVQITAVGALHAADVRFNPGDGDGNGTPTAEVVGEVVRGGVYLMLAIVLLITFFRRLMQRLIDVRAALLDGVVVGALFVTGLLLNDEVSFVTVEGNATNWMMLVGGLVMMAILGSIVMLFAVLVSGTVDSLAREVWPEKLLTTSLVRHGTFRNGYVGASLLRGVCLAGLLLGLMMLVLVLIPDAALHLNGGHLLPYGWIQPMAGLAAFYGVGIYLSVLLLLGALAFVARLSEHPAVLIGAVVVLAALVHASLGTFDALGVEWGVSALFGLVLAWVFWRYDLLTTFVALFLAMLGWALSEGWLVVDSPAVLDVWLFGLLAAGLAGLGFVGIAGGRRGDVAEYTPAYIRELTQQERMQRELEIAHQVQESFLPRRMPHLEGLEIAALCLAAQEVGGDYYDVIKLGPGRLGVAIGDVSGKGIQAAFYMTLVKGFLQTLAREETSPAGVLRRLNALFCENAPRGTFISMIYGVLDVEARTFVFARAGHNPLILKRSPDQMPEVMKPSGMAIGLTPGLRFDETIQEQTARLRTGDVLVLYTDGISEATNMAREQYGDARLARKVGDLGQRSASEVLRVVTEDVHRFVEAAGRHDDMTMVVLKLTARTDHQAAPAAARPARGGT